MVELIVCRSTVQRIGVVKRSTSSDTRDDLPDTVRSLSLLADHARREPACNCWTIASAQQKELPLRAVPVVHDGARSMVGVFARWRHGAASHEAPCLSRLRSRAWRRAV